MAIRLYRRSYDFGSHEQSRLLEVANSIFQFIEETKPWFLHDSNAE